MRDSDGLNREWSAGGSLIDGGGFVGSVSYDGDAGSLNPNNRLISPEVPGGGSVSFMYVGQDPAYCAENFGVYVSEDGGASRSDELGYFTSTAEVQTGVVDLSAYEGKTLKIAFRHYNTTAQFMLNLDAVIAAPGEITESPTEEPPTETPTEPPAPPVTGFVSLAGAGIAAILAGTGVVLFRRKKK